MNGVILSGSIIIAPGISRRKHLLRLKARRIGFVSFEDQASTVGARISGHREALSAHDRTPAGELRFRGTPGETFTYVWKRGKHDSFVCANDRIAGQLMQTLLAQGVRIPEDVRIVGIDDVSYAKLLPVPLTTVRQPCRMIGETALRVMLERIRAAQIARSQRTIRLLARDTTILWMARINSKGR